MWLLQSLVWRGSAARVSGSRSTSSDRRGHRRAVARRAIVGRGSIARGERAGGSEELGQLVGDLVDAIAELVDELGLCLVVEVTDETGRKYGVVEELLGGGSGEGDCHASSIPQNDVILNAL
jgi:hypothetical protein